ncbi:MAG: thermonuclease family protein [Phycisphaerae bacterium]
MANRPSREIPRAATLHIRGALATLNLFCAAPLFADLPKIPDFNLKKAASAQLLRVLDGNTVLLQIGRNQQKLHLLGVDAPASTTLDGKLAIMFLENLLTAEDLRVRDDAEVPTENEFGERTGYLHRASDGLCVNLEMIRQAYAVPHEDQKYEHRALFNRIGRHCRDAKKGIWKSGENAPALPIAVAPSDAPAAPIANLGTPGTPGAAGLVYVTKSGSKYHLASCRYAKSATRTMPASDAARQGLEPCSFCKPQ